MSRPNRSELVRRIEVNRNFELAPNQPKLERLSNRLFDREALNTKTFYGSSGMVTIAIKESFDRLIYFGWGEHAQEGIIVPSVAKPPTALKRLPADFPLSSIVQSPSFYPKRGARRTKLGSLTKIPGREEILRGSALFSIGPKDGGVEASSSIFKPLPEEGPARL